MTHARTHRAGGAAHRPVRHGHRRPKPAPRRPQPKPAPGPRPADSFTSANAPPLRDVLAARPTIRTNQDLINFFYADARRVGQTPFRIAALYGLDIDGLAEHRPGPVSDALAQSERSRQPDLARAAATLAKALYEQAPALAERVHQGVRKIQKLGTDAEKATALEVGFQQLAGEVEAVKGRLSPEARQSWEQLKATAASSGPTLPLARVAQAGFQLERERELDALVSTLTRELAPTQPSIAKLIERESAAIRALPVGAAKLDRIRALIDQLDQSIEGLASLSAETKRRWNELEARLREGFEDDTILPMASNALARYTAETLAEMGESTVDEEAKYPTDSSAFSRKAKAALANADDWLRKTGRTATQLHQLLRENGFRVGGNEKVYGKWTALAVMDLQAANGLRIDGIVGPRTWEVLSSRSSRPPALPIPTKVVDGYIRGKRSEIRVMPVGENRNGSMQHLRSDAGKAFLHMLAAARAEGIHLGPTSGFRSHEEQIELRRRFLRGKGNPADPPGYSKHQGGISMDIKGVNGYGTRAYRWLKANAPKFGFVNNTRREYWHWSYLL